MTELALATTEDIIRELQSRPNTKFVLVELRFKPDTDDDFEALAVDGGVAFSPSMEMPEARTMLAKGWHYLNDAMGDVLDCD